MITESRSWVGTSAINTRGGGTDKRDTLENQATRVKQLSHELFSQIDQFAEPKENKVPQDIPAPALDAINQISNALRETEDVLKGAIETFRQLTARIRG